LAWLVAKLERKPLVWDVFMSTWLIARERGLESRSSLSVSALYAVEWLALRLPNLLIQDTKQYVDWFSANFGVPRRRFALVPTGADSDLFSPFPSGEDRDGVAFTALYYGSYIPNHDAPTIVRAAALLKDRRDVRFVMIGDGPQRAECLAEAQRLALPNIRFVDWLSQEALKREIAAADLCLGAFGNTPQSRMTVQNKIYECLAMGKPVLTGASDAVADAVVVGEEIAVCARRDPQALANAIVALHNDSDLRQRLAANGAARFQRDYTIDALGEGFRDRLLALLDGKRGG
jgi:glycosyltransferase involved in cell wall biosynthesis